MLIACNLNNAEAVTVLLEAGADLRADDIVSPCAL